MSQWADVLTDIRFRLNEPAENFWTDDELLTWANEGARDVARRLKCLRDVESIDTVVDQSEYDMPEDMIQAYRCEYRQSSSYIVPLEYAPLLSMDDIWGVTRSNSGIPGWWSTDGYPGGQGRIVIFPAPSETIADGIRLYYYRLPRPIADVTDDVEVPSGWEDLVSLYVEWNARRKEATDAKWRDAQQLYELRLDECRKVTQNYSDQASFVSGNSMGSVPWWVTE